jgi:hypothetical protein
MEYSECDGHCFEMYPNSKLLNVEVGHKQSDGSMTGVEKDEPVSQDYCPECANTEFGIDVSGATNYDTSTPIVTRLSWLTPDLVVGFVFGLIVMLMFCSFFTV